MYAEFKERSKIPCIFGEKLNFTNGSNKMEEKKLDINFNVAEIYQLIISSKK